MTNGNAGISGTEFSPIGSAETLEKDGPECDFSVIREKVISQPQGCRNNPEEVRLPPGRKQMKRKKPALKDEQ